MVNSAACIPGAVFDTLSRPVQVEAAGCGHVVTTDGSRAALAHGDWPIACHVGKIAGTRRRTPFTLRQYCAARGLVTAPTRIPWVETATIESWLRHCNIPHALPRRPSHANAQVNRAAANQC